MAHTEYLTVGGSSMEVYVDAPAAPGPHPGVVVTHHRGALDDFTRKFVEGLAAEGYIAAAPAFYHRRPAGEDTMQSMGALNDGRSSPTSTRPRTISAAAPTGATARSASSATAWAGARRSSAPRPTARLPPAASSTAATSSSPGARATRRRSTRVGGIGCPVIGFFGNEDENPSPDDVARIGAAMTEHGSRPRLPRL